MTDRELLELAAKAAGIEYDGCTDWKEPSLRIIEPEFKYWNPLTDDGDALRLAVKLNLTIRPQEKCCHVWSNHESLFGFSSAGDLQMNNDNPYAAARRAIVRAAAEIGKEI